MYYKLVDRVPVECSIEEMSQQAADFEKTRRVGQTLIGEIKISTVFLAINHSFENSGEPILFETMIFGGKHDEYQERCATWEEAEKMHSVAVELIKSGK